jgi:hypothetical protein
MSLVVGLSQVVNPQDAEAGPVYAWANLGRAIYVDWWKDRFLEPEEEYHGGKGCFGKIVEYILVGLGRWFPPPALKVAKMVHGDHQGWAASVVLVGSKTVETTTTSWKDKGRT